jgi:homogentisate 1,2-dioxygenase
MGTLAFDHPDPSIHTVLTAPLDDHGRDPTFAALFSDPKSHFDPR